MIRAQGVVHDIYWYKSIAWFTLAVMICICGLQGAFSKLVEMVKGDSDIPQVDTHWMSESGVIDVFFLMGPTAGDTFKQYATLTGTTPLPPVCLRLLLSTLNWHISKIKCTLPKVHTNRYKDSCLLLVL